mgnify:CR=1 FL=1
MDLLGNYDTSSEEERVEDKFEPQRKERVVIKSNLLGNDQRALEEVEEEGTAARARKSKKQKRESHQEHENVKKRTKKRRRKEGLLPDAGSVLELEFAPEYLNGASFNEEKVEFEDYLRPSEKTIFNETEEPEPEKEVTPILRNAESTQQSTVTEGRIAYTVESGGKPIKSVVPPPEPVIAPKKPTTAQKEKQKVKKRSQTGWRNESESGGWKTNEEMVLRQHYH